MNTSYIGWLESDDREGQGLFFSRLPSLQFNSARLRRGAHYKNNLVSVGQVRKKEISMDLNYSSSKENAHCTFEPTEL